MRFLTFLEVYSLLKCSSQILIICSFRNCIFLQSNGSWNVLSGRKINFFLQVLKSLDFSTSHHIAWHVGQTKLIKFHYKKKHKHFDVTSFIRLKTYFTVIEEIRSACTVAMVLINSNHLLLSEYGSK